MPSPHLQGVEFQTFAFDYIYFTFIREQTTVKLHLPNTQIVFFQLWADGLCKVCRVLRLDLSPCSGQVGFPVKKETYLTELLFYHFHPGPTSTRMWSKAARSWRCFIRPLRYWHSFDRRQHIAQTFKMPKLSGQALPIFPVQLPIQWLLHSSWKARAGIVRIL